MLSFIKMQYHAVQYPRCAAKIIVVAMALLNVIACSPQEQNPDIQHTGNLKQIDKPNSVTVPLNTQSVINIAAIATKKRGSSWLGGSPPINKRASGIDTYYQILATNKPNNLLIKMQFEGVKYDDAYISLKTLDGAKLVNKDASKWQLNANEVSEVTFEVSVPENISYLSLYTFQNGKGATRAFLLRLFQHFDANAY